MMNIFCILFQDIRAYFQTNRKTTEAPRSNQLISNSNSRKRVFLESDSEDEKQKTPDNRSNFLFIIECSN